MKNNIIIKRFIFALTFALTITYLTWRTVSSLPLEAGKLAIFFGIVLLLMEAMGLFQSLEFFYSSYNAKEPERQKPPLSWYLDVDVFITVDSESEEMVRKSVNGCINMDYPEKERVHVYICDDAGREDLKILANKMGVNYIVHSENLTGKAGILNYALSKTTSPLVAVFQADMIPMNNFLTTCVPYFYMTKVGFIQSPKSHYNPDLFSYNLYSEKRIPDEQEHFNKDIQIGRNKTNSVIYTGTNAVLSREALEDIGGFCTKTLVEDFSTGVMIQSEGYYCYAIETVLATGHSPSTLNELIKEKKSLVQNGIQSGKKLHVLFRRGLDFPQRLSYLSSIFEWYSPLKRFIFLLTPILFSVFNITIIKFNIFEFLVFFIPTYALNIYMLKDLSNGRRSSRWNAIYETILSPFLLSSVFRGSFGIKNDNSKNIIEDDRLPLLYLLPHGLMIVFSCIGILKCVVSIFQGFSSLSFIILSWLVFNLYLNLMSVFFLIGRKVHRKAQRYKTAVRCLMSWEDVEIECQTHDISENGFSFLMEFPHYIPTDTEIETFFIDNRFISNFKSNVVAVGKIGSKYKYSAKITSIDFYENNRLYSIVYNREPSAPTCIVDGVNFINDILINIEGRVIRPNWFNRRLARIELQQYMKDEDGDLLFVKDFNYEFLSIEVVDLEDKKDNIIIPVTENIKLNCQFESSMSIENSKTRLVYKVLNLDEIADNPDFIKTLRNWIGIYENQLQQKLVYLLNQN